MRYIKFKTLIRDELIKHPSGLTWKELKNNLALPYQRPCPTWVNQLEQDIGLVRIRETRAALIWKLTD
jgi:hypothetical protein